MKRRRSWLLAGMLAALLLVCTGLAAFARQQERVFYTHDDVIRYILETHDIRYRSLSYEQSFEESINLRSYSAAVRVQLLDGRVANGWIGCEDGERQCFLELRSIGIAAQRLPDINGGREWPLRRWLRPWLNGGLLNWLFEGAPVPTPLPPTPTPAPPV